MTKQSDGYYTGAGAWRPIDGSYPPPSAWSPTVDICQLADHDWTLVNKNGVDSWICRDCESELS